MSPRCAAGYFDCGGHPMNADELQVGDKYRVFKKWCTVTANEPGPVVFRRLTVRNPAGDTFTVEVGPVCSCSTTEPGPAPALDDGLFATSVPGGNE